MLTHQQQKERAKRRNIAMAIVGAVVAGGLFYGVMIRPGQQQAAVLDQIAEQINATPKPSATPKPKPKPAPDSAPTLSKVRDLISGDGSLVVSVLGDSTGNASDEWVGLWAERLAEDATVSLHIWDARLERWGSDPIVLGDGDRSVTIYNGSQPGATPAYVLEQDDMMQPARPHLLITNYGHNGTPESNQVELADLREAVAEKWDAKIPTIVTIQNPATAPSADRSAENQKSLRAYAKRTGLPIIDIQSAFEAVDDLESLLIDDPTGVHPDADGQLVWVDAVTEALG